MRDHASNARPRRLRAHVGESGARAHRDAALRGSTRGTGRAHRELPDVQPGDLLAVESAGAYGFVQASNYNSRTRPPEVLVDGAQWKVVRTRETWEDLIRGEELN